MPRNEVPPYDPRLRKLARRLRKNGTLGEVLLWGQLRRRQLNCEFHRQVPIGEYIVDFYCHELKLGIEVDGSGHAHEVAVEQDDRRQRRLEGLGVMLLRFSERDVRDRLEGVVETITEHIAVHGRKTSP